MPAEPGPLVDGEVADPTSVPDVEDDSLQLDEHEVETEALVEGDLGADELEEPGDSVARRAPVLRTPLSRAVFAVAGMRDGRVE